MSSYSYYDRSLILVSIGIIINVDHESCCGLQVELEILQPLIILQLLDTLVFTLDDVNLETKCVYLTSIIFKVVIWT